MIKLIVGTKGSGKTKVMIDEINQKALTTDGCVVCIEKAMSLIFALKPQVRLVRADDYDIKGYDAFYGFLCGLLAGNYDIKDVYVDGILRIGSRDLDAFAALVEKVDKLTKDEVTVIFTVSTTSDSMPNALKKYVTE